MNPDSGRGKVVRLIGISFVSLFLELALIRFVNSTVQVVAYFNNFLLLSAFLGLGVGSLRARHRSDLFALFPWIAALVIGLMVFLDRYGFISQSTDQIFWAGVNESTGRNLPVPLVIVSVFCANFLFFVPLGYKLGQCLEQFDSKLEAYAYDLLGSLLGVIGFGLISWWRTSPVAWFAIAFGAILLIGFRLAELRTLKGVMRVLLLALAVALSTLPGRGFWSPYYKVTVSPYFLSRAEHAGFYGFSIMVDKLRIQDALFFSTALRKSPLAPWIPYYDLPYEFRRPSRVLILGGGAGNDATVALARGADRVDVVEIDPVIVQIGFELHPHKPYLDKRVRVITDDARAFLRRSRETYDLIVMNALDSHHQLPGLSTLRLESFVYTAEAFRDVSAHMRPDTLFVVHLGSSRQWMGERLYWTLTRAFHKEPRLFTTRGSPFESVAFAYGPAELFSPSRLRSASLEPLDPERLRQARSRTVLATDDWPHLYLQTKRVPGTYVLALATILALSLVSIPGVRQLRAPENLQLFLLGAGFMLLETRSITKTALLFGATWVVNAIVVGAILMVILLGNLLVLRNLRMPKAVSYLALFASLLIGYFVPMNWILEYPMALRIVLAGVWTGAPIFFASLVFSQSFARASQTSTAFGANLLGVVFGGVLEYSSMIVGLNLLYVVALVVYLLAAIVDFAFLERARPGSALPSAR